MAAWPNSPHAANGAPIVYHTSYTTTQPVARCPRLPSMYCLLIRLRVSWCGSCSAAGVCGLRCAATVRRCAAQKGSTALHLTTRSAHNAAVAELLLAAGAAINARNACGETALVQAARANTTPVLKALLGRGADVHAADEVRTATRRYHACR
jgi:hypothetical protein